MRLDRLDIRASADVGGVITNRVEVRKRAPKRAPSFRQDPTRPKGYTRICVSVSPEDLELLDRLAADRGLSRSRFLVVSALATMLTADEAAMIALARKMRRP